MLNFKKKAKKDPNDLLLRVVTLETKIKELEKLLQAVKEASGEFKKQKDFVKKNKWLNGYPDESVGRN